MGMDLTQPKQNYWSKWGSVLARVKPYSARLSADNLWRGFFMGGVGLLFIYLLINMVVSRQWVNQPFAGFLHQNRVVTEVNLPGWQVNEPKIGEIQIATGDVILSADGHAVSSSQWLKHYVQQKELGQTINYSLQNQQGNPVKAALVVSPFTLQNFVQVVVVPSFIAFMILIVVGSTAYLRVEWTQVKLFTLFSLALVCALISLPEFITSDLFVLNFSVAFVGKIMMPPLLLHFLLLFSLTKKELWHRPYLLPLTYLPVLPALIHVPILFIHPETTRSFDIIIDGYTIVYGLIGLILLAYAVVQTDNTQVRNQAIVLIIGLITIPVLLLAGLIWSYSSIEQDLLLKVLEKYGFVGVPVAVALAVIRYKMFNIAPAYRAHFFYLRAIVIALAIYFFLIALLIPNSIMVSLFRARDGFIILLAVIAFFSTRFLYRLFYRWWLDYHFYSTIEELKASFRIFTQDVLKVKSKHDLELLVSWNIPLDFGLEHAEFASSNLPSYSYALRLPLSVGKIELGTLFLGPKVSGGNFTRQEQALFSEIQKQISLVLFSLELDEAIRTIEELTRLKSKFLTNVTHELRAPLNGIINYIGFVIDDYEDSLNEEQKIHLNSALQGAEKLVQIINNILDMSKIEARQMSLNLQFTNLAEIVSNVTPLVEEMINDKPVNLVTDVKTNLPHLYGDRLRLRQIILNMLTNAAKFTEAGSIRLKAYPDNGNLIIQVTDTGIGIDKKILPTIFEQFTSDGLIDADQRSGPGLSMPITKSLIELHGGQLNVESQPGQGTTFTVTLPIQHKEQAKEEGD